MKKLLLSLEAFVLLAPLTVVLCYTSVLTVFVGIPASVMQQFDSTVIYDTFLPLSAIGNVAGVYALVVLWSLVVKTIQAQRYVFSRNFKLAVAAGVVASACLVIIYGWPALVFGLLPPLVVAVHFVFLQKAASANA
jgi:hypothetical protein